MEEDSNIPTIDSIKEIKECIVDIPKNLEPQPECCIFKVPKDLRKIKEEAYTPQVVSIGPLHYNKKELIDMEIQKIRYQREFNKRIEKETWQELVKYIKNQEQYICNCYQEMPKFGKDDFIIMILYDAIFIIELFLRSWEGKRDFLLDQPRLEAAMRMDLQLLENQLPYSILERLYQIASPRVETNERGYPSFFTCSLEFFCYPQSSKTLEEATIKHFVDLRRNAITRISCSEGLPSALSCFEGLTSALKRKESRVKLTPTDLPKERTDLPASELKLQESGVKPMSTDLPASALKLQESGVKFTHGGGGDLLDIKFKKGRIPWLQVHNELQIPQITVDDETERLIRNVMALEQCHYPSQTHVCSYIALIDDLINTKEDVNLLVEAEIISNQVGDTDRIAKMFNELCLQITVSTPSCYEDIIGDLREHYKSSWSRAKATLKRVYFTNYWRGTGTIAATMLLLLTFIQTLFSGLQWRS
ncbi:hypothetical protein OWV82_022028 [Melia azedarach]|uniref:Uncharacterized protein n=2 Tax=Melia azedarach TaxID=155640 RepID=A0ACC1X223_MELAZ|nr:hypothetical protein OWV82_022028 [Melia azedarach]KAJ4705222.1 hypothetical protein OWV82_022028 [Melia azedarach]